MAVVVEVAETDLAVVEHSKESSSRYTHVEWMLGNTCTYACSYCPAKLHDGSVAWLDYDSVLRFIDKLHVHYAGLGQTVWLQYTGGEPTLYPKFIPLIEACRNRGFRQSVISNGVRTLRFWRDAAPHLDYVILTYHIEFVDRDHFFAVVDQVRREAWIHVNVTMLPEQFDACYDAARSLHEQFEDITLTMKPLRKDFRDELYGYSSEQLELLRRQFGARKRVERTTPRSTMTKVFEDGRRIQQAANAFIVKKQNSWRGWRCAAGVEALRIMADGTVYRSQCRVGGPLGKIDAEVRLPSAWVTCDRDRCSCISDILLTKVRN
jgi:MoaA/NifB/PqqE/SkfB family radical SAM enzyme